MGDTTADPQDGLQEAKLAAYHSDSSLETQIYTPKGKKIGCALPILKMIIDAKINLVL